MCCLPMTSSCYLWTILISLKKKFSLMAVKSLVLPALGTAATLGPMLLSEIVKIWDMVRSWWCWRLMNCQIWKTGRNFCMLLWHLKACCLSRGLLFFKESLLNVLCSFIMMGSQKASTTTNNHLVWFQSCWKSIAVSPNTHRVTKHFGLENQFSLWWTIRFLCFSFLIFSLRDRQCHENGVIVS